MTFGCDIGARRKCLSILSSALAELAEHVELSREILLHTPSIEHGCNKHY